MDDGRDGNNWDLNAVLRSGCHGPMPPPPPPPTRTANNPVARYAPPPPAQPSYAFTVLAGGLGHQAISVLPQPQALDQDPPHAAGRGPSLDLPLLPEPDYTAAVGNTPAPLNPPWPRNEIPVPSVQQRPADKHKTPPSSGCDAAEGSSRSKKRDNRTTKESKVVLVLAEDPTPPDSWAWRKYGQKSIKDTPYHRSYYRCSTDKKCKARKHVQRCLTQSFLAVSYIGEHSHPMPLARNGQAGTTHQKPPPRQPTSPFIRTPAKEDQPHHQAPAPPPATSSSPFAMISAAKQTPAPPASASPSLQSVSAMPLGIKHVEQPPQASAPAPALAPSAASASPMMSPTTLLRPPYADVYKEGDDSHSHPIPFVCNCLVCTTRQKTPLLVPPSSSAIETRSWVSQPALLEQQQTPALPASASASLSSNTPVSPLLSFQAEERPTQVPAPALPPSVSTLMSPSALLPPPSVEFDNEKDDDAVAVRMLLNDMDMTPEDALKFVNPEEEPLDGVGDDLLIPTPEELAPFYYGDEENMLYPMASEPASGGSRNTKA
ncbi:hypothetical protein BDA96_10G193900 [Sorghum bicolor]|uniref:WRKY domain-containing protein n=1 Tax=Sorghum bicolor TaxID=4558 RepID=A0A921U1H2_SORBI|nr:hypothetical protein BDA96_10G193900 [Sorghum bicolor]